MKFGKRLAVEAARCWPDACLDYKAIKRALKHDLATGDPAARTFLQQLLQELSKVSAFYVEKAGALEAALAQHTDTSSPALTSEQLSALREQIRQLIKFVALNYLAVVKAIKKRNRHCRVVFGGAAAGPALHPLDLLRQEVFFTSPRLAALSTQAELLAAAAAATPGSNSTSVCAAPKSPTAAAAVAAAAAAGSKGAVELEDYQCPICLDVLRSPVVLTCAHRFCWGCLVAHCASITGPSHTAAEHDPAAGMAAAAEQQHHQHTGCSSGHCSSHQQQGDMGSAIDSSSNKGSSNSLSRLSTGSNSGKGLVALEKLVSADASGSTSCSDYYNCPVCRQPQVLKIDNLQVDPHLSRFVDELRLRLRTNSSSSISSVESLVMPGSSTTSSSTATPSATLSRSSSSVSTAVTETELAPGVAAEEQPAEAIKYLLPRQLPQHAGRLTVLLDLDGTLVSSFTPRRAPRLPPSMKTHLVGVGSSLNPSGVFVVERPGLQPFLEQLATMAEVVVFTAGLEEYAAPIIEAIDPTGTLISDCLYRPACTRTAHHQCIKDLVNLGRPLSRTVLVDDTPLAFLHQPANGVPVLGFRGDPDDRLLMEAVLPLLQTLASAPDVRSVLERRFGMLNWFKRHGYPDSLWQQQQQSVALVAKAAAPSTEVAVASTTVQRADMEVVVQNRESAPVLLVCDFDKTLTNWDAGERIVGELAPELVPWLTGLEQPANFVPVTNEVLTEMARRGVSRDKLLTSLQLLGSELPGPVINMLQWASNNGLPVKVLSDCNSVFINHILSGARLSNCVAEVITNAASFEKVASVEMEDACVGLGSKSSSRKPSSYRLVIQPRHPESSAPHGCPLCPANLCKGSEVHRLKYGAGASNGQQQALCSSSYGRIVYAGDGANDICPALALGENDVILARAGYALAQYAAAAAVDAGLQQIKARVFVWESHQQLAKLVKEHVQTSSKC